MTQSDFHSAFRNLLHEPLPPAPDPRRIAFELFRRDQRRTRVLAALSMLFWVLATAGIFLLVFSLNRVVMETQARADASRQSHSFDGASRNPAGPGAGGDAGGTLVLPSLPPAAFTKMCAVAEASAVALLIAALLTVALVFSSRQATLNRINLTLMQISEQLMPSRAGPPGEGPAAEDTAFSYSIPAAGGWSASSILIKLLLALVVLLLVGVPTLWVRARISAQQAALAEWRLQRRLSPFEAVQWKGMTPHVRVGGTWYELVSMDGLSAAQVVARCQALDPQHWQKRFEEDLVEVLMRTGHPIGDRTMLEVKDQETGQVRVLMDVPLTRENRDALWRAGSTRPADAP